jgi:S-DNA-T family DNA segregation ATPase FtsK/SpoIIIE
MPDGELPLEPPPAVPATGGVRWQQWLSFLPMLAGTLATALMFGGREGSSSYTYVVGGVFGLSTLGMLVLNVGTGGRKADTIQARRDYLRYLSGVREKVRAIISEQREALAYRNPEPASLWAEAIGERVWERRVTDADFAVVRVGVGEQSLATELIAPVIEPTADLEPVTAAALRRFLDTYAIVPDLPVSLALRSFVRITIRSDHDSGESARSLARAVIGQLATFHAPDDLVIAACVAGERRRDWEWLKWLPHALHPSCVDAVGPRRLVAESLAELDELLAEVLGARGRFTPPPAGRPAQASVTPHVILLVDALPRADDAVTRLGAPGGLADVTTLDLSGAARVADRSTIALRITPEGRLAGSTMDNDAAIGRPDQLGAADSEGLARRLARLRLSPTVRTQAPLAADRDLVELLAIGDIAHAEIAQLWAPRAPREALRIPIGTGPEGDRVDLDIKEAAQDGMGPHGLVVGATGSGKSELLRTLVLGLAATHSSEMLNVVLVDFKGGATFASLDRLPHTSAVITNLADELPLVDRMNDALAGELTRRQEVLRKAGNLASLREYDRARASRPDLPPLPVLLLVCDEFTELLTAKPDFIDLFLQIGRVGRSLGVHLLLATQRLEEGRLRGLESNLSYKIALRTFTAAESRIALGVTDAADLPSSPGHGYLKVGTEALQRFKAAYVSGPYTPPRRGTVAGGQRIHPFPSAYVPSTEAPASTVDTLDPRAPSLMDIIVGRLQGQGPPAHRVWLPPLADAPAIDTLLGGLVHDHDRGVTTTDRALWGALRVPLAVQDRPFEQRRDTAWLDLSGAAGHVAIVGNPQSGKSTAARTLITGLALTHTPSEVQIYGLDFGGGSLTTLRDLPHVGGVFGRLEPAAVRRTVGEVATLLADRERRFAARGIDSMATFRRMRRPSEVDATVVVPEDGFGDVFLVVDGWATVRNDYDDLEPVLTDIATRGLSYGVHVVATASRWSDFRASVKDLFGSKVELRLGDPVDSHVNRRLAANVPPATPGRGLWPDGLHILTALPQAAGHPAAELYAGVAAAWTGQRAPAVRMLPERLPYDALLGVGEGGDQVPLGTGLQLPLGIAESDLRPVLLDFADEPHLVAFGDHECGKSTLLRSVAESIVRRFTPEQARIVIVDYRRSLLGAVGSEHLIGYGSGAETAGPLLESVAGYMDKRRPGPDITPQQLRDRSWWTGPECFVLVDDYDLVAGGPTNPVAPLLPYLSQARDVGLHLIVTRRAGGAGRAQFEPILQRLRELGTPGLVMSGERDEGPLVGTVRPSAQPPGRGFLVTRRDGSRLVQLAHVAPAG